MKKIILFLSVFTSFLLINNQLKAQDYKTAVGLKFGGYESGVSFKYFTQDNVALEGVLGFRDHGVVITGLFEMDQTAFNVPELKFYYGAGAHIGAVGSGVYKRYDGKDETYNNGQILLGIDGVIGLEYLIPKSPIAISLDLNPRIELATGPFLDLAPGLGVKYTF